MDYYENATVLGWCPSSSIRKLSQRVYVNPPQNVLELNNFLCGRLNRTGVMCHQCQEGLGAAIFSYSMQCLPCMSSGLGWTLYVFLATFPTTILCLIVFMFQLRITSGPFECLHICMSVPGQSARCHTFFSIYCRQW